MSKCKNRLKRVRAKSGQLKARFGRDEECKVDIVYAWGEGTSKSDAVLLQRRFNRPIRCEVDDSIAPSLLEQLEQRGYDLTTLKFSIRKKTDGKAL